ncbi:MAG: RHS repeat protein, partial [Propionibacteriaceae bacterium]|nr:RHS repeat protein [Propionibacteriaceae bacterium]
MAKFDAFIPATNQIGPNAFELGFFMKSDAVADWSDASTFFYAHCKPYVAGAFTSVSGLYGGTSAVRVEWDGRKSTDRYAVATDTDAAGEVWADRPENVEDADVVYDGLTATIVNARCLARLTKYSGGQAVPMQFKTCPLPQKSDQPMMGRAPYTRFYSGVVNSQNRSLSLTGSTLALSGAKGPAQDFRWYFNGNSWRHTSMGFGFTHTYEMRMMPVRVGGQREVYFLAPGDHLLGPVDENNHIWVYGTRCDVTKLPGETGWQMKYPDGTVYAFARSGQLKSITDWHGNALTVTLAGDEADLWRKLLKVQGAGGTYEFDYNGGHRIAKVYVCSPLRPPNPPAAFSIDYRSAADVYGVPYAPDEVVEKINDGEYEWNFGWKDVWRKNRVSRVHLDALTSDLHYTYTHTGTPEEQAARLATLAIEAKVTGVDAGGWRGVTVTDGSATYNGVTETHNYSSGKITAVTLAKDDRSTTFSCSYSANGELKSSTSDRDDGTVSYEHDARGAVESVQHGSYSMTEYDYERVLPDTPQERYVLDKIRQPLGVVQDFTYHSTTGELVSKTLSGGGLSERIWGYTFNSDGTLQEEEDPFAIKMRYSYDESSGRVVEVQRVAGIHTDTSSMSYDFWGNVTSSTDVRSNRTTSSYDRWGRLRQAGYSDPDGDEAWTYTKYGFTDTHRSVRGAITDYAFTSGGKPSSYTVTAGSTVYPFALETDDWANVTKISSGSTERHYVYDYLNRVVNERLGNPEDGKQKAAYIYNGMGDLLVYSDAESNQTVSSYDVLGRRKTLARPGSFGSAEWQFDSHGRLERATDSPGGDVTVWKDWIYGSDAKLDSIASSSGQTVTLNYDAKDRVVGALDEDGNLTEMDYDARQMLNKMMLPGPGTPTYEVTNGPGGDRLSSKDPLGHVTTYGYYTSGLPQSVAGAVNTTMSMTYGPDGQVKTATAGSRTVTNTHNNFGEQIQRQMSGVAGATQYEHDVNGPKAVVGPEGVRTEIERESDTGLVNATVRDPGGQSARTEFDNVTPDGRMDGYTVEADSNICVSLTYNELNVPIEAEYSDGVNTLATIKRLTNAWGQVTEQSSPGAGRTTYGRDSGTGLITSITTQADTGE